MNFIETISAVFKRLSLVQKAMLGTVLLTFIIAAFFLTRWAGRPDMRMLYDELTPEDAAKITDKLTEMNIPYELKAGGTCIYAPKENLYQLRVDMAKEGLPSDSQGGYKIFDEEKIGISPFVQNVNLQRALQDELAKSIQMVDGIKHARVHIVRPDNNLFHNKDKNTSASVVLRLQPGFSLAASNIASITHLVSGAVEGLKSDNVTIVDSEGKLLSKQAGGILESGAGTLQDYRERVEKTLTQKAEKMLKTVLGSGRSSVEVSAEIDTTSIDLTTEKYDPDTKVASKEEITSSSEVKNTGSGNEENSGPDSESKEETILTEYKVSKTVEKKTELAGEVKSVSVAAFVDLSKDDANSPEGESKELIMSVEDVEEVIKNALGLQEKDNLKVVNVKFNRQKSKPAASDEEKPFDYAAIAGQASLGIMAICALITLKIFSGSKKNKHLNQLGELQAGQQGQNSMGQGNIAGMISGQGPSDPAELRKRIASALKNNPQEAKQLFSSWIENKG